MSWRRVVAAWAGPLLDRGARAPGAPRGSSSAPPAHERAPRPAGLLAPALVVPGPQPRRGRHPASGTRTRCSGYRFAADPQSGWLYAPADGPVHGALPGRRDASDDRAPAAPRGPGPLRVPAGRRGRPGRAATARRPRDRRRDGGERGRDRDAVRRRGRVDDDRPGRRGGLPARGSAGRAGSAWIALGGFAWSQVASAHLSHGLVDRHRRARRVRARAHRHRARVGARRRCSSRRCRCSSLAILVPRFQFVSVSSLARRVRGARRRAAGTRDEEAPIAPARRLGGLAARLRRRAGRVPRARSPPRRAARPAAPGGAAGRDRRSPRCWSRSGSCCCPRCSRSGGSVERAPGPALRRRLAAQPRAVPVRRAAWRCPRSPRSGCRASARPAVAPCGRVWVARGRPCGLGVPLAAGGDPARWRAVRRWP